MEVIFSENPHPSGNFFLLFWSLGAPLPLEISSPFCTEIFWNYALFFSPNKPSYVYGYHFQDRNLITTVPVFCFFQGAITLFCIPHFLFNTIFIQGVPKQLKLFTALFNNMQNLKFKSLLQLHFLLPSINMVEVSENEQI